MSGNCATCGEYAEELNEFDVCPDCLEAAGGPAAEMHTCAHCGEEVDFGWYDEHQYCPHCLE